MAKKMATSRSQLDRVLDPSNVSVQLDTLIKAARALGDRNALRAGRRHDVPLTVGWRSIVGRITCGAQK